jgi:hypothetical protein
VDVTKCEPALLWSDIDPRSHRQFRGAADLVGQVVTPQRWRPGPQ